MGRPVDVVEFDFAVQVVFPSDAPFFHGPGHLVVQIGEEHEAQPLGFGRVQRQPVEPFAASVDGVEFARRVIVAETAVGGERQHVEGLYLVFPLHGGSAGLWNRGSG